MSCQVKHWIYMKEVEVKYVETKKTKEKEMKEKEKKVYWFRWFIKIEKPVEVWEDAFPWP